MAYSYSLIFVWFVLGHSVSSQWYGNGTLTISWNSAFATDTMLLYEVTVGTRLGGSDVMQWVETMTPQISIFHLDKLTDYHLTLTAINAVGLSKTINKVLSV